jgi:hypothetical protein
MRCGGNVGAGVQGDQCEYQDDCEGGYDCVRFGQANVCARFCRLGGQDNDCGARYTCTPFLQPAYDGTQEIGTCV